MIKLTEQNLAPYLPYRLRILYGDKEIVMNTGNGSSKNWIGIGAVLKRQSYSVKPIPILYNINKLTKYHANNCGYNNLDDFIHDIIYKKIPVKYWDDLLFNHWDLFGLIENDLAIDYNDI